jgi:hypothetical protein
MVRAFFYCSMYRVRSTLLLALFTDLHFSCLCVAAAGMSLTHRRALANQHQDEIRVYATDLPEVYEASFLATANPDGMGFRPTLVLVGTRLGIDKINHVYEEALIATLQAPQSVGIAG